MAQPTDTAPDANEPTEPDGSSPDGPDGSSPDGRPLDGGLLGEPQLDARSAIESVQEGDSNVGVSLREIEDEPELPALQMGPQKYQVLKFLSQGGMGKVFMVYDRDLKRRVALKVMRDVGRRKLDRFIEEAHVMGQLQHPNIVPVHELGVTDGRLYYTMPLLRGQTLRDILDGLRRDEPKARRTYSLTRLIQIFLQVTQALSYAHERGVIHRDLKPDNIMIGEHGEVQLLDWGLAKVLDRTADEPSSGVPTTQPGHLVGTPSYMSPEQARGWEVDERSDVYSLGVILYEMLTLKRPFDGVGADVLGAVVRDTPMPPRARAPKRDIPLELEVACLRALQKSRDSRTQSVVELIDALQQWLEAEAEISKRRERGQEKAQVGRDKLETYLALKRRVVELEQEVKTAGAQFESWRPVGDKRPLFEAEDRFEQAQEALVRTSGQVLAALTEALGFDRENPTAREALADLYWDKLVDAERSEQLREVGLFEDLIGQYHDGKYTRQLRGDGSLQLTSDPTDAEVWLYDFEEIDLCLQPRQARCLGRTPLGPMELPRGRYLVVLKAAGCRDVNYPILIRRNGEWTGAVNLYREDEIGADMVMVPAGPSLQGGAREMSEWALPRREVWVDDFLIGRNPVTMAEYIEFLNDLPAEEGDKRSPRRAYPGGRGLGTTYLQRNAEGRVVIPEVDADGDHWEARWPVFGVSWHDAMAYCEWRTRRDGREVRLPSEDEWEKAARGVDGREFPWGNRFDPSLCNSRESRHRTTPVVVDEFPTDVSVYGMVGAAGNVKDWTATEWPQGHGGEARAAVVVRGGAWTASRTHSRAAIRSGMGPSNLNDTIGFRVASTPRRG